MTETLDYGIIDAVGWLADEVSHILDTPPNEEIEPIKKLPQSSIPAWTSTKIRTGDISLSTKTPNFHVQEELNEKIFVGQGNIICLEVDAIVVFIDETNKYTSHQARLIQKQSGCILNYEPMYSIKCTECTLIHAYNIGSPKVVFAMNCRFSNKYPEASSNILNTCIRNALKCAIEHGVETIAYPLQIREFPDEHYVETLCRTLRRFLENETVKKKIKKVFLVYTQEDSSHDWDSAKEYVTQMLQRFFPRDAYEESMSADIARPGNELGELADEERNIRIGAGFATSTVDRDRTTSPLVNFGSSSRVGNERRNTEEYTYYLKLAYSISKMSIYKSMRGSNFVRMSGNDKFNRPVIVVDARDYTFSDEHEYALAYALGVINPFIQYKFVIAVLHLDHSIITSTALLRLLRDLCHVFGVQRTKNIAGIYFHRCGWALKGYLGMISAFLPTQVWEASMFVDSLEELKELNLGAE
ncbi:hypothetical protein BEWA_025380 [Theileria equi strain WA]|uniref:Macro domain-containing protein n=1 Tax=Theileria equi strain WA TaxID=1537102 RepID=L0AXQ4_THEEQ|nr:hypothetical protein BEWA_025380 [Theileria equi strain WA]AFZ79689.1 hypothetical protein BEWA_025380 [Theileria equi strain WA]|eukprot:XP_004829355.1 hypothetical protein BEWA_025380 [Theileria equi strain WA]